MTKFDYVRPPQHFARHHKTLIVIKHYAFTCDNRVYFSDTRYVDLEQHTYQIEVELWSKTDDQGMAVDFKEIDAVYNHYLAPKLEGQLINDTLPEMNTTVENIAHWIWQQFHAHLPEGVSLNTITLFETPDQGTKLTRNIMAQ
ncbi:6-pyruvoyl tetrahydrobiopterin synthase [Staphylococcus schleiferi]|uniref:6-pyruvoyl trahydropterin synthase family protein n=1 Tax=Staphylococcus schleiferi TaxID=1295 RepID=UPI00142F8ABA|nr:6-carboxytetrahydropterin synthase [Staphylococcus schleiferi]NHA38475.1 6-pyruvoyl tetrahydrobiopterin synthase [Staphylococcus schleiferi]NHA40695.1 6-pyruvoyl tetrahydrobiopterin synthase [Staphylococcus schleiferi]